MFLVAIATCFLFVLSSAQSWFPPPVEGVTIVESPLYPGVSISYKQTYICETTPGVKSYSGYVHLPSTMLQDIQGTEPYNASLFFWYFQARNDPDNAPLSFYFAGGPGESSMHGVALEGGPCIVNSDGNSTRLNPWSFNNHANMLYIDQPVQTGFSYSTMFKSTLNLLTEDNPVPLDPSQADLPDTNATFILGTLPSQNPNLTVNTTGQAARTIWHFSQIWLTEFPEYTTNDDTVSMWTNSYGGYWGTVSSAYILDQNKKIRDGTINGTTINLNTLGMMNDCFDLLYQTPSYADILYNNTYDLQVINQTVYDEAINSFTEPGGCRDLILACRTAAAQGDPLNLGNNATVNSACINATAYCPLSSLAEFSEYSNRSAFDLANVNPNPWPEWYYGSYFNQQWVQQALGVPVNLTVEANILLANFLSTGDLYRQEGVKYLEYILNSGVKVAMSYGDRDSRCNWLGAENASLVANFSYADDFRKAGYQYIHTNDSYLGGTVRQYDNFSFSRVFQAGHSVMSSQPETSYQIFTRAMLDKDISTGNVSIGCSSDSEKWSDKWHTNHRTQHYGTTGPSSSWNMYDGTLPAPQAVDCYLWNIVSTCTDNQIAALAVGNATIVDSKVVDPAS